MDSHQNASYNPPQICFSGCVPDNVQEQIELPTLKDDGIEINFEY